MNSNPQTSDGVQLPEVDHVEANLEDLAHVLGSEAIQKAKADEEAGAKTIKDGLADLNETPEKRALLPEHAVSLDK